MRKFGELPFPSMFRVALFLFMMSSALAGRYNNQAMANRLNLLLTSNDGPFSYTCGELAQQARGCPYAFELFQKDKEAGFINKIFDSSPGQAPVEACKGFPQQSDPGLWESGELEEEYSKNRNTKMGLEKNYFSQMMNECYEPSLFSENPNESQYERNSIVAMSYHYLNRVRVGNHQTFMEVSNINSLLGKEPTADVECDSYITPDDAALCTKMESMECKPQGGLAKLTESLGNNAIYPLIQLKKKLKTLRTRSKKEAREKVKATISMIEQTYPILQGDKFERFMEDKVYKDLQMPSVAEVQGALREQLESNKAATLKRIEKNNALNRCLIYGHRDDCDDFDKKMADTPQNRIAYLYNREDFLEANGGEPEDKNNVLPRMGSASAYYSSISCLDDFREIKTGMNELALDTGINLGLVIGTMGAGAVVGLGRTAMLAHSARAIALTANSGFLAAGVSNAINVCQESFNKLVGDVNSKQTSRDLQCPEGEQNPSFNAVDDMRSCVVAALLTPIDALPFVPAAAWKPITRAASRFARINRTVPDQAFDNLVGNAMFRQCLGGRGQKAKCDEFIEQNRERFKELAGLCIEPRYAAANAQMCRRAEEFMKNNSVLRLSDLIPTEKQGRSVVVEFSGDRGHLTLRYMMEVTDDAGNRVMKSFSQDGSSFLFPRRINERWFQGRKGAHELGDIDKYVPGSHYIIDATPEQLETMLRVQQRGGFSRACTHDARKALHEAGILKMPRGLTAPYKKVGVRSLAKDLTSKYGPPDANTTRAIQEFLDPRKAGFSDEQWKNFLVTEAGWAVLSPLAVLGLYPAFVPLSTVAGIGAVDSAIALTGEDGEILYITIEKLRELYSTYADEHNLEIPSHEG
ncbi:MAG: hypothetical protein NXH75_01975 [Halobacteriovoraceae bacterium]|nr:hypothetical protein [Halobacteriovoraceae bacterium]